MRNREINTNRRVENINLIKYLIMIKGGCRICISRHRGRLRKRHLYKHC